MKLIKRWLMGGSRRSLSSKDNTKMSSTSRKRRATGRGDSDVTDSSSNTSSSECAPWRVEKIRVEGPPRASDWWCEPAEETDGLEITISGDATTSRGSWMLSSSQGSTSMDDSKSMYSTESASKKFHNCGLETWEISRAAWLSSKQEVPQPADASSSPPTKRTSQKELGKILSKASSLRTYELPRRVPLKDMVESYQVVWNGKDD